MAKPQNTPAFGKLRFVWKRLVNEDANLSRGAKQMASCLCDTYVNKDTGRCWPKTPHWQSACVDKRTVQLHIKMLE